MKSIADEHAALTDYERSYAAAIPPHCEALTLQEHKELLLCWSLAGKVESGEAQSLEDCRSCERCVVPTRSPMPMNMP